MSDRPPPPAPTVRRVLVVDDNRDAAESLALLLRGRCHEVEVAYDGADALDRVTTFHPEIVILDVGLPVMSGYEVAERIRAMPAQAGTALVAMTGYGTEEDRDRAMNAGFDIHLVKPVDPQAFDRILADPAGVATRRDSAR